MPSGKVIIIGASTGIGYELAKVFSQNGFELGITSRRMESLLAVQKELPGKCYVKRMDVTDFTGAKQALEELIGEMGGLDILVLNAGIGESKPSVEREIEIIMTNCAGFTVLAHTAYDYFVQKGGGQIVGISSIASLRGTRIATVYAATKAYVSHYLEGLRQHASHKRNHIIITDIRPGFVATPMTEKNKGMIWVSSAQKAAGQIYTAIIRRKKVAYITRRWAIIAFILKRLPDAIFYRF